MNMRRPAQFLVLLVLASLPAPERLGDGGDWVASVHADDDRGGDRDGGRADDDREFGGRDDDRFERDDREPGGEGRDLSRPGDAWYEPTFWPDSNFERDEIVVQGLTGAQLQALQQRGYRVLQERPGGLRRLRVPSGAPLDRALAETRALDAGAVADRNHLYRPGNTSCGDNRCRSAQLIAWPRAPGCSGSVPLGLIDTGVDLMHPALRGQAIESLSVRSADRKPARPDHGTAVASVLVGARGSAVPGLLPGARLIAVDAFHRRVAQGERMDAFDLAVALRLMSERDVAVVNLSFTGPPNALVERAVREASARGVVLVAAAGNDGPHAAPRYPAAYPGVIAVTAVDAQLRVYRRAGRGTHIAFAAPGVGVWAANAGSAGSASEKTGTSYAAPFVTAAIGLLKSSPRPASADVAAALRASARDLGVPGHDPVFGHGLIQAAALCAGSGPSAAGESATR
jgi:hypothetical protein